jgi:hypothetical protein
LRERERTRERERKRERERERDVPINMCEFVKDRLFEST